MIRCSALNTRSSCSHTIQRHGRVHGVLNTRGTPTSRTSIIDPRQTSDAHGAVVVVERIVEVQQRLRCLNQILNQILNAILNAILLAGPRFGCALTGGLVLAVTLCVAASGLAADMNLTAGPASIGARPSDLWGFPRIGPCGGNADDGPVTIVYTVLAAAAVIVVIAEVALRRHRNLPMDRHETIVSASVAAIWLGTKAIVGATGLVAVYGAVYDRWAPWHLDVTNPLTWAAYLLVGDFAYYWVHRAEHEIPLLWASHVVHHSAEDFSVLTAIRVPPTEVFYKAAAGVWAPLLGFPPAIYAPMAAWGLISGGLHHTRLIGGLGPLDRWLSTSSSNHRVHHGSNPRYLDKNFGSQTMIWDRLFGTYEPETEPVRYGATEALRNTGVCGTILGGYPRLVRNRRSPFGSQAAGSMARWARTMIAMALSPVIGCRRRRRQHRERWTSARWPFSPGPTKVHTSIASTVRSERGGLVSRRLSNPRSGMLLAVVSVVALVACAGSTNTAPTSGATATSDSPGGPALSPGTSLGQDLNADRALAASAVLQLSDMPQGWQGKVHTNDDSSSSEKVGQLMADCLHVDVGLLRPDSAKASADSQDFSSPDNKAELSSSVGVAPSVADVQQRMAIFHKSEMPGCLEKTVGAAFAEELAHPSDGAPGPTDLKVGQPSVAPLNFPKVGDDTVAFRITTPFSLSGLNISAYIDFIVFTKGRARVLVTTLGVGASGVVAPISIDSLQELAQLVASRLPAPETSGVTATTAATTTSVSGRCPPLAQFFGLSGRPVGVAVSGDAVWVTSGYLGADVQRLDAATGKTVATVRVEGLQLGVSAEDSGVWVAGGDLKTAGGAGAVTRIDPSTNTVTGTVAVSPAPIAVAAGFGSLWATSRYSEVVRIDPVALRVIASVPVGDGSNKLATGEGAVWVVSANGTVSRIDPATNRVTDTIDVGGRPQGIAAGAGAVWVTIQRSTDTYRDGTVLRIDPGSNRVVATIGTKGGGPMGVAVGLGSVWVTNYFSNSVSRINPTTNQIDVTICVAGHFPDLAIGRGEVWVSGDVAGTISRFAVS